MVWKVVKSAQPPVRYRRNSDRQPDIVAGVNEGVDAAGESGEAHRRGAPLAGTANSSPVETPSGSPATSCGRV